MKVGIRLVLSLAITLVVPFVPGARGDGYFQSVYESIVQAQATLREVATTVNKGLKTLAETMKFVEKFVDSTVEEECQYSCPKNKVPVANPNHIPDYNGCGALGVFFEKEDLSRPEMVDCCNEHDLCYDTCGSDKDECDLRFKKCLYNTCNSNQQEMEVLSLKACKGGAKLLYTATLALGCTSYKDAQEQACICVDKNDIPETRYEL